MISMWSFSVRPIKIHRRIFYLQTSLKVRLDDLLVRKCGGIGWAIGEYFVGMVI